MVFLPLSDNIPGKKTPYVLYGLIVINVFVFLYEVYLETFSPARFSRFIEAYAMVPEEITQFQSVETLVTSMFLHGGFMHIFANMLFLYIFGNNVEDSMGHLGFFAFYMLCGFAASFLQVSVLSVTATSSAMAIPHLGASGAIAGVLGAYMVTYPKAKVNTLIFFGLIFVRRISALFFLGFWFVIQLFSGAGSIVTTSQTGVAYFAHIGGFLAGVALCFVFRRRKRETVETDEWEELLYRYG